MADTVGTVQPRGICQKLDRVNTSRARRWMALVFGSLELFLFSGYHFGIFSISPIFKEMGLFACPNATNDAESETCVGSDLMISYAFIVWTITQMLLVPLSGIAMDRFGLRSVKLLSCLAWFCGTMMFAGASPSTDWILFPAGILVAISSITNMICNQQISRMFPERSGLSVAMISGAFDSNAFMPFVFAKIYPNLSLSTMFSILGIGGFVWSLLVALFLLTSKSSGMSQFARSVEGSNDEKKETQETLSDTAAIEDIKLEQYPTVKGSILSLPFMLAVLWMSIAYLRFSYFLAGLIPTLEDAFPDDKETVQTLQIASSCAMVAGFFVSPLTGFVIDLSIKFYQRRIRRLTKQQPNGVTQRKLYWNIAAGMAIPFFIVALLSHLLSGLLMLKNVEVFYFALVIFVLIRSFLFSSLVAFVLTAFPHRYFGTLYGLLSALAGLFSLVQYGLLELPVHAVEIGWMVGNLLLYVSPLVLFLMARVRGH